MRETRDFIQSDQIEEDQSMLDVSFVGPAKGENAAAKIFADVEARQLKQRTSDEL